MIRMGTGEAQTAWAFGWGPAAYAASREYAEMEDEWKGGREEGWKNGRVEYTASVEMEGSAGASV
ncbi:MAG: hypothetical protein ABSD38_15945 [Syntrophorhabdales bacterium]